MTEGTKSYLFGCHQFFVHPLLVLIAWIVEYRKFPRFWEFVCIFIHDIGHYGTNYLTNDEEKRTHWIKGARLAKLLFGWKGYHLVCGHTTKSGCVRSKLFIPDKKSWLYSPDWWLNLNYKIEDFKTEISGAKKWKKAVAEEAKKGFPIGCHEIYIRNRDAEKSNS